MTSLMIKLIIQALREDKELRFLLIFIVLLLTGSTIFYMFVEDWTCVDALYFSVITMTTVGYGDLTPTTDISKVFTIIYTFLSIGVFVSFAAKLAQMMFIDYQQKEENFRQKMQNKKTEH